MTEELTYIPIYCILCNDKMGFIATEDEDSNIINVDNLYPLCETCEARTNGG